MHRNSEEMNSLRQQGKKKYDHEESEMKLESYSNFEIPQDADKDVPTFIGKLSAMLVDLRAKDYIYWSSCGDRIVIPDQGQFSCHVLPL